jgi:hypothetical protein
VHFPPGSVLGLWTTDAGEERTNDHVPMPWRSLNGVFIGTHAVAEGALTPRQLREGPYVRVLRGVYADPSLPHDHLLRCRAAALLMPAAAALGARSAAAVLVPGQATCAQKAA